MLDHDGRLGPNALHGVGYGLSVRQKKNTGLASPYAWTLRWIDRDGSDVSLDIGLVFSVLAILDTPARRSPPASFGRVSSPRTGNQGSNGHDLCDCGSGEQTCSSLGGVGWAGLRETM